MKNTNDIINFIRSHYNEPEAFIPLHAPIFSGNEKAYLNECIDSTFVSSVGEFVNQFEQQMAQYTGSKYAIVCVNGTNALQIALQLVGVQDNDEVITQPLSFVATANAIKYCNADPVFVDVDIDTMGISPKALEAFLATKCFIQDGKCYNKTTNKHISACAPMHTLGHPCRIDEIVDVCNSYHIPVVEDAAESVGSTYKGKHCGTFGKLGIQSFNGNKIITCGGGGMILTNNTEIAQKAKHITNTAKLPHKWAFYHDEVGYNFRMPNINAAIGLAQLEKLDTYLESKRLTAKKYHKFFDKIGIKFFSELQDATSNYWLNAIIFDNIEERNHFLEESNKNGIMTRPLWELLNRLPMYQNAQCAPIPNAEWLADRVVNIPSSVKL